MKAKIVLSANKTLRVLQIFVLVAGGMGTLGAVLYPLRNILFPPKISAVNLGPQKEYINAMRSNLIAKKTILTALCKQATGAWPSYDAVVANDLTKGTTPACAEMQLPNKLLRVIVPEEIAKAPLNPAAKSSVIVKTSCTELCKCADEGGYLYNPQTGLFGHKNFDESCKDQVQLANATPAAVKVEATPKTDSAQTKTAPTVPPTSTETPASASLAKDSTRTPATAIPVKSVGPGMDTMGGNLKAKIYTPPPADVTQQKLCDVGYTINKDFNCLDNCTRELTNYNFCLIKPTSCTYVLSFSGKVSWNKDCSCFGIYEEACDYTLHQETRPMEESQCEYARGKCQASNQ